MSGAHFSLMMTPRGQVAPHEPQGAQPALTDAEQQQCLHAQELLWRDLQPPELLRQVPHSDALAVHPGFVHAVPRGTQEGGEA